MMQIFLVGLGAGVASALLFASFATGSILAILLFYLAPLPILIVALGWNHWAGLVAGFIAAAGLGAALGITALAAFLIGVALPAWWLAYLTMLARPVGMNGSAALEWYPIGRLVLWAAIISAVLVMIAIPNFGTDKETLHAGLRSAFERAIRLQMPDGSVLRPDTERLIAILVAAVPPAAAVLATVLNVCNLWLAGRIVRVSGRLHRPWPNLSALTLPVFTPGLLAMAVAGTFLADLPGIFFGILAASLLMACAILGFAVLHAVTRGIDHRGIALGGTYVAVIVFGWPVLALSLLGLAEFLFNIRTRVANKRGPPKVQT
jgi:hypothetical protein